MQRIAEQPLSRRHAAAPTSIAAPGAPLVPPCRPEWPAPRPLSRALPAAAAASVTSTCTAVSPPRARPADEASRAPSPDVRRRTFHGYSELEAAAGLLLLALLAACVAYSIAHFAMAVA